MTQSVAMNTRLRRCQWAVLAILGAVLAFSTSNARAASPTPPTVAILYFDYQGETQGLGVLRKGLAQMLITDLSANEAFLLVERDRIEALLNEHRLGLEGKLDPISAAQVGKLLGARYMVLGGFFDLNKALRVDARLVEVETGRVLGSIGVTGSPGDFLAVERQTAQKVEQLLTTHALAQSPAAVQAPQVRRRAIQLPAKLSVETAVTYASALDQIDHGNKPTAVATLKRALKEQPDFALAALDLDRLGPL